jgi:8-oxo-dGTP diphosphatase
MCELPVESDDGSVLLSFQRLREDDLRRLDPSVPLTASLVVLWCGGACLMVFHRRRRAWESPREAALRELEEESGQRPHTLHFAGAAQTRVAPDRRLEFLAIYRGSIDSPKPFTPNEEMSDSTWWDPDETLADLHPVDASLARLCRMG